MILVDLHVHSTCSDGTLRPADLPRRGAALGLSVLSLTDHDSTEGIADFLVSCRRHKIAGISGVELSAEFGGVLHILGYRFNPRDPDLDREFAELRVGRDVRNREICLRLQKLGLDESRYDVVLYDVLGDIVCGGFAAVALILHGAGVALVRLVGPLSKTRASGWPASLSLTRVTLPSRVTVLSSISLGISPASFAGSTF